MSTISTAAVVASARTARSCGSGRSAPTRGCRRAWSPPTRRAPRARPAGTSPAPGRGTAASSTTIDDDDQRVELALGAERITDHRAAPELLTGKPCDKPGGGIGARERQQLLVGVDRRTCCGSRRRVPRACCRCRPRPSRRPPAAAAPAGPTMLDSRQSRRRQAGWHRTDEGEPLRPEVEDLDRAPPRRIAISGIGARGKSLLPTNRNDQHAERHQQRRIVDLAEVGEEVPDRLERVVLVDLDPGELARAGRRS